MAWPIVEAKIERQFTATHALRGVAGGSSAAHEHQYTMVLGFTHEMPPSGLCGSKALIDWDASAQKVIDVLEGADLNALLHPIHPTIEVVAYWIACQLPAYFAWVELSSYSPKYTVRIAHRGRRLTWPPFEGAAP